MRILVAEDEKKTAAFIRKAMQAEGLIVHVVHDGNEVVPFAAANQLDAIVLDIMLPGRDGLSVLRQLRARRIATPVLLLSARGAVDERVEGLNAGADDYLPKPFALDELIARVRALGRRSTVGNAVELHIADLTLDTVTRKAERRGERIDLTPREFRLLEYLLRSAGQVCSRTVLLEQVWDYHFDPGTNLVDVYIKRLREKIDAGSEVKLLHNVRGVGYMVKVGP